jgi:hypothetical protein
MTDFASRLSAALRDEAEEFAMNVDIQMGASELEVRLANADRRKRWTAGIAVLVAVAAVTLGVVGFRLIAPKPAPQPQPVVTRSFDFSSTEFGLPFSADLPTWVTTYLASPISEKPEWTTWNRCPDQATECIGLSFNRTQTVPKGNGHVAVTYASYLSYLDDLARSGAIEISARSTTTVGGRPATVMSIQPTRDIAEGVGCHADLSCEDFLEGLYGRYAVVDSASIDQGGETLVIWTRAGAIDVSEFAWLSDFDAMLTTLRFDVASPAPS